MIPFPRVGLRMLLAVLGVCPCMAFAEGCAGDEAPAAKESAFGVDTSGMDRSVAPGDDFYRYANGAWLARTPVPADHGSIGVLDGLRDCAVGQTRAVLEAEQSRAGSRLGVLYSSILDEQAIERAGLAPMQQKLLEISRARDRNALTVVMASMQRQGARGLYEVAVVPDDADPARYVVRLWQSGTGIGTPSVYQDGGVEAGALRAAYQTYVESLLHSARLEPARDRARAVVAFEGRLAARQWSRSESADSSHNYNPVDVDGLADLAPGLNWKGYLAPLGLAEAQRLIASQPSALKAEAQVWAQSPLDVEKDWLVVALLDSASAVLPRTIRDAAFRFHGQALTGLTQAPPRWRQAVDAVSAEMPSELGQEYVARHFPAAARAKVQVMVARIIRAYRQRIQGATWLSDKTRREATAKLDAVDVMVGYPDTWPPPTRAVLDAGDAAGNIVRLEEEAFAARAARLGHKVTRGQWDFPAMATHGWAVPNLVEIAFPAGMLQPPVFDAGADDAVNYGAIGSIVGHEVSHLFDTNGSRYDARGRLAPWWNASDRAQFEARMRTLVSLYDGYSPLPDVHINGSLTSAENFADLAGLAVAYDAYHLTSGGKPAPVLSGFSGDQRFYLGFGQLLRVKYRDAALKAKLAGDEHAPSAWRVREVRNLQSWYDAFGVTSGQSEYLEPARRVPVW